MITKISYSNFRKADATHELTALNSITGANGAGKSTISKAIDIALLGHSPDDKTSQKQRDVYFMYARDKSEAMTFTLEANGHKIYRIFWIEKKDVVSSELYIDDNKLPRSYEAMAHAKIKIFKPDEFFALSDSKRIDKILSLTGKDPLALKTLVDRLAVGRKHRLTSVAKIDQIKSTISSLLSKQKTNKTTPETDYNLDQLQADLETSLEATDSNIISSSKSKSLASLKESLELLKSNPPAKSSLKHESVIDLKAKLLSMREDKQKASAHKANLLRLTELVASIKAIPKQDTTALKAKIDEIKQAVNSGSPASIEDKAIYKFFKTLVKPLCEKIAESSKEASIIAFSHMKEAIAPISKRCRAKSTHAQEKELTALRVELSSIEASNEQSSIIDSKLIDYKAELATAKKIKLPSKAIDTDKLESKIATIEVRNKSLSSSIAVEEHHNKSVASLKADIKSIGTISPIIENIIDAKELQEKIDLARNAQIEKAGEQRELELLIDQQTALSIEESTLVKIKDTEKKIKDERILIIKEAQSHINDIANKSMTASKVSLEIGDTIKFYAIKSDGSAVERESLSGAEKVEYDCSLGRALMGDNSTIVIESDHMNIEYKTLFMKKISQENIETQYLIIGHTTHKNKKFNNIEILAK